MYGSVIIKKPRGKIDAGDGKAVSNGTVSLIAPTDIITETGHVMTIDGVEIVFQMTPGTEAPAEMNFYLPRFRALCAAENAVPLIHDVYTLRGAEVRDAKAWAFYLYETIQLFGDQTNVMFTQHLWPRWGQAEIVEFLGKLGDLYQYMHDQTLRLANHGYTMVEIAEQVELPTSLSQDFDFRGYYGTVNQNVKAVYQKYLGWFDGNPAHLHRLPPEEAASRYVEFMGGVDTVIERAIQSFHHGDYRWVAEIVNHVIFADPSNQGARELLAHTYEQLGYQAEAGPWRNFYLTGAAELRRGVPSRLPVPSLIGPDVASAMTADLLLDYMGVRLNGPNADGLEFTFLVGLADRQESYLVRIRNSALSYEANVMEADHADAALLMNHPALVDLALSNKSLDDLVTEEQVEISGNVDAVNRFLGLLDTFEYWFNIVTP
jgi:alkyl sulfatase BDS1-like metallo-beta-lactamase superfamily hydrolase